MARETILIVDDSVVTLKLAAAALRGDGYRVHLASNAEQALTTLRTMIPDLILVDVQLPGMNGLEMARRVRQDARTAEVLMIAFTAALGVDDMHHAFEAGCDGYVTKPIDIRLLGERIRGFIDGNSELTPSGAGTEPPPIPPAVTLAGPEMDALRRKFLTGAIREVRRMLEFLNAGFDAAAASRKLHQWIGSAGALGYPVIAEQARQAEQVLAASDWSRPHLRTILSDLAGLLFAPREAAEPQIPDFILNQLVRRRVALIGFSGDELDDACAALARVGAMAYLFDPEEPLNSASVFSCAVVIVHVCPGTMSSPWLRTGPPGKPSQPHVHVGGRDELLALPPQARAVEFLIDGWQPEELLMRLSMAISRAQKTIVQSSELSTAGNEAAPRGPETSRPRVIVADDDANVVAVVTAVLAASDVEVRSVTNGAEALRLIRESSPHAAVLDVNMPDMDGFEVLAAIRRDKLPVRIVMLTARQQERDVVRAFELGADDYVAKPFNPLELVARLKRLV
jgi:two-component system, cell cycle response regulator DivK